MRYTLSILLLASLSAAVCAQSVPTPTTTSHSNEHEHASDSGSTSWSHLGGDARHQSLNLRLDDLSITTPIWTNAFDENNSYIPIPQSGLVSDADFVYSIANNPDLPGSTFAVAFDCQTGELIWNTPIPGRILDSWSTPTLDLNNNQLIIAIADQLIGIDTLTGGLDWSSTIPGVFVNASPVVTNDLGPADRAFISNYSFGGGGAANLFCINIDPFHSTLNPYQPGDIVWQSPLTGDSSGNTPAYADGTVYIATASSSSNAAGLIHAFDATSTVAPSPSWTFTNTINTGFFGGLTIAHRHIFASSYSFTGLQFSANTVKINKNTGDLVWSIPTNRTDAMPAVLPNGDLIVSGGVATGAFDFLPFFGSLPSISYIQDNGDSATLLWDTAIETHNDTNSNGVWDFGESFLSIGGWTHQPLALILDNKPMLAVGTLPETTPGVQFAHNTDVRLIDLTKAPTDPGFIVDHYSCSGSTPAFAGSMLFVAGESGISAFQAGTATLFTNQELVRRYFQGKISRTHLTELLTQKMPN